MDASVWDERYAAADLVWSAEPNQFVAAELADLPPGDALDLACGEGRNALWLARRGWQVTAVDFSAVAIDRGRRLGADLPVNWRVGDVLTLELPQVDLVVLAYLQLPADERRRAVSRAFDALRPGGTMFLVAHDTTNLTEGTGGPPDPRVLYSADDILQDLQSHAGEHAFRVVRAGRTPRVVHAGDEHRGEQERTAWDAMVRVVRR